MTIAEPFAISLPAVSRHLKVLEAAGLISRGREAQWRPCRLETQALKNVDDWLSHYRRFWTGSFDKMDAYIAELKTEGEAQMSARLADDELLITRTFDAPSSVLFALWSEARAHEALDGACEFHLPRSGDRFPRRRRLPRHDHFAGAWRQLVRRRVSRDRAEQAVGLHLHLGQ